MGELSGAQLLTLARWLSPAFPTGGFAWSHGLEQAVAEGAVGDVVGLEGWLEDALRWGAGRTDAILIGAAWRAEEAELAGLVELAVALGPSRERRAESWGQGAALAGTLRAVHGWELPDAPWPVALGRAARLGRLPAGPVAAVALQGWVTTLVQAGQRLMPLGQSAAQGILARLAPVCEAVASAVDLPLDAIGSCGWAMDVASMRHEVLSPRIFRS